jgi:hypothetical protein
VVRHSRALERKHRLRDRDGGKRDPRLYSAQDFHSRAEPNASLPWHIHNGACGSAGEILGSESAYPALQVSGGGTAEATVTLAIRPSKTGSYAVQVHKGTAAPDKPGSDVISCGDLKPVMNKMPQQLNAVEEGAGSRFVVRPLFRPAAVIKLGLPGADGKSLPLRYLRPISSP